MKKIVTVSLIAITVFACKKTDFKTKTVSAGSANFTTFISVGNSLTQGYMDAGVYEYGQDNSYPNTLAKQMKMALPSMNYVQAMTIGNGSGHMHLAYVNGQIDPITATDSSHVNPTGPDPSWTNWGANYKGTLVNNMGISGIRLTDCVAIPTSVLPTVYLAKQANWIVMDQNPYARFMNIGTLTTPVQYIDNIRASKATFFTCWLGDNDVLGFALSGGVSSSPIVGITVDNITPPAVFAQKYDSILAAFSSLGAQGVCMTIPNVTSIPYFNTVPTHILVNGVKQYFYITQWDGTVRLATDKDYILLPAYDSISQGEGTSISRPIPNGQVLDSVEADSVLSATIQYNNAIFSLAKQFNFAVVDINAILKQFQVSYTIDGISFSRTFIQGGMFGLDGIHPNARGYAVVANYIIDQIDKTYGATLPEVDITKYKGIIFPNF